MYVCMYACMFWMRVCMHGCMSVHMSGDEKRFLFSFHVEELALIAYKTQGLAYGDSS